MPASLLARVERVLADLGVPVTDEYRGLFLGLSADKQQEHLDHWIGRLIEAETPAPAAPAGTAGTAWGGRCSPNNGPVFYHTNGGVRCKRSPRDIL